MACLHGLGYLSASRNVISDNLEAGVISKEFFSGMFSDDDSQAGNGFHPRRIRSPQVYPRADQGSYWYTCASLIVHVLRKNDCDH